MVRPTFWRTRRAGSTDGKALRDAIAETKNLPGVTGGISQMNLSCKPLSTAQILKLTPPTTGFVYHSTVEP